MKIQMICPGESVYVDIQLEPEALLREGIEIRFKLIDKIKSKARRFSGEHIDLEPEKPTEGSGSQGS